MSEKIFSRRKVRILFLRIICEMISQIVIKSHYAHLQIKILKCFQGKWWDYCFYLYNTNDLIFDRFGRAEINSTVAVDQTTWNLIKPFMWENVSSGAARISVLGGGHFRGSASYGIRGLSPPDARKFWKFPKTFFKKLQNMDYFRRFFKKIKKLSG